MAPIAYEGGGYSFSVAGNITQFGRFDPVANTWDALRRRATDLNNSMASGVYAPNVNKLFVFGGQRVSPSNVVNTTRIYDIATDTWTTGAPMPDVRAFMGSGYHNGKIYLVGGYTTGNVDPSFGQVWQYDPVANTWDTSRASMPITLGGPGSGIINGHIYIAGGRNLANTNLNTLYDYDIAANTWTARANLPTGVERARLGSDRRQCCGSSVVAIHSSVRAPRPNPVRRERSPRIRRTSCKSTTRLRTLEQRAVPEPDALVPERGRMSVTQR